MITKEQWFAHPSFRQDLSKILNNKVLAIALEIAKEEGATSTQPVTNVSLVEWFALNGAKKDGYREAFINLRRLAEVPPARPPEKPPWSTHQEGGVKTETET